MQIIAKNVSYTYSKNSKSLATKAINNISVEIEEGDFFGIVGHTGSGKSTFIQHLNGLIKLQENSGSIQIGDFDLTSKKCDFKALRSKVGMVFQYPEYQLFAETVAKDVAFGLKNCRKDLTDEKLIEEEVKYAINLVGLNFDEIKDKSPFELSGGQKRRVAIAGVLVLKPEVLILDEPAAGLDPRGKTELIQLLKGLHKSFVKTIVIVSHDMNLISENCNKVVVFNKGEIVKKGTPKEIFSDIRFIEECGLDLPVVAYLTQQLKAVGVNIDSDYTLQDFTNKYAMLKGESKWKKWLSDSIILLARLFTKWTLL